MVSYVISVCESESNENMSRWDVKRFVTQDILLHLVAQTIVVRANKKNSGGRLFGIFFDTAFKRIVTRLGFVIRLATGLRISYKTSCKTKASLQD